MTQIDQTKYSKNKPVLKDGKWWYPKTEKGYSASMEAHIRKNTTRMFVNGKYVPKTHPLHKPGRYKSLDDVWSHEKIESTKEGDVYVIVNNAWPDWVKIGMAIDAEDRCNGYQTGSPHRDYALKYAIETDDRRTLEQAAHREASKLASESKGEWFKLDVETAIEILNNLREQNEPRERSA